jgi:glutathione-regulated potassium-efflux system protein KefB
MNLEQLVVAAILFLGVSAVFVTVAQALRLGAIFGFLFAGIALGPHTSGPVLTDHVDELLGIGELGVVLLMFAIGLEMQPSKLWAMRRLLFGLGSAQVLITGALLAMALLVMTSLAPLGALMIGLGLALSSTAIVMQVLGEKGEVATEPGRAAFAVLVLQDIASVLLLIVVPFVALRAPVEAVQLPWWEQGGLAVAALVGTAGFGRYLLPWLFSWTAQRQATATFGVVVLLAVLLAALVMDRAGLSMAMGSFLLGVTLSASDFRYQVEARILPLKGVFMGLFFVAVGMSIDLPLVLAEGPSILGYVGVVIAIKVVAMALLGRLFGLDPAGALRAAFLLAPCSEFGFVLFASTKAAGLLSEHGFAIAVAVVSLTMAATPFTVKLGYGLAARRGGRAKAQPQLKEMSEELENHVVVAGYGRSGRLMCLMLEKTATPYIAFDLDLARIKQGKLEGHEVHYGDVTNPHMQGAAAFAKAKSVVVTLEDMAAATHLVSQLRQFYPHLPIQLAAPDLSTQDAMRRLGVSDALCTAIEGDLQLGEAMLRSAGVAAPDIESLTAALRHSDYALIRGVGTAGGPASDETGP